MVPEGLGEGGTLRVAMPAGLRSAPVGAKRVPLARSALPEPLPHGHASLALCRRSANACLFYAFWMCFFSS